MLLEAYNAENQIFVFLKQKFRDINVAFGMKTNEIIESYLNAKNYDLLRILFTL